MAKCRDCEHFTSEIGRVGWCEFVSREKGWWDGDQDQPSLCPPNLQKTKEASDG